MKKILLAISILSLTCMVFGSDSNSFECSYENNNQSSLELENSSFSKQEIGSSNESDGTEGYCTYQYVRVGAICNDGTVSSSTGSGTCSWHGGVYQWLYDYVCI